MAADEARGNVALRGSLQDFIAADLPGRTGAWERFIKSLASVSAVNSTHLDLRKFVYLQYRLVGGSGNQFASVMMTGRGSERRVVTG